MVWRHASRPKKWGIEQVIGQGWQESEKLDFGLFLLSALVLVRLLRALLELGAKAARVYI